MSQTSSQFSQSNLSQLSPSDTFSREIAGLMAKVAEKGLTAVREELKAEADCEVEAVYGPVLLPMAHAATRSLQVAVGYYAKVVSNGKVWWPNIMMGFQRAQAKTLSNCGNHYFFEDMTHFTWEWDSAIDASAHNTLHGKVLDNVQEFLAYANDTSDGRAKASCSHRVKLVSTPPSMCHHNSLLFLAMLEHIQSYKITADGIMPSISEINITEELYKSYTRLIMNELGQQEIVDADSSPLEEALNQYAFRYPVLAMGPQGSGKTRGARRFSREQGFEYVEIGGHEGVTTDELCGFNFVHKGSDIWIDGTLSQACRMASKGKKVVFVIDELLRIPSRQLSILLTVLSPYNGYYYLNTGRIVDVDDGVAKTEVLEIPVENLTVVATTNVGPNFQVDDIDPALRERFYLVWQGCDSELVKQICLKVAASQGIDSAIVDKMMVFFEAMQTAYHQASVADTPSTRMMCNALLLSKDEKGVKEYLKASYLQWVSLDQNGKPNEIQRDLIFRAISHAFGV